MAVRKVAITLSEELYELVQRARAVWHRSRSEVIQEALRACFSGANYPPSKAERAALVAGLKEPHVDPTSVRTGLKYGPS
ncbi:ribbon-helix-helix protein, CopG family [Georgenia phoenicis]|uniref:ribbon-helix-helix protein, CopG family n=1 Tax=unclassified Georgenia TaxID=2626815 RepID=UPI0039B0E96E